MPSTAARAIPSTPTKQATPVKANATPAKANATATPKSPPPRAAEADDPAIAAASATPSRAARGGKDKARANQPPPEGEDANASTRTPASGSKRPRSALEEDALPAAPRPSP